MAHPKALLLSFSIGCLFTQSTAQAIVQSCVKDIVINGLTAAPIGATISITVIVDNDDSNPKYTQTVPFTNGDADLPEEICFDFDTSTTTNYISYNPKRGGFIALNILDDAATFGGASALFPNPSNGSVKSAINTETVSVLDGTMTFTLYHQISTAASNLFLKIANRNFNVFRQCFDLKRLCLYEGGIENPQYPSDCSANFSSSDITLNPDNTAAKSYILNDNDADIWTSTPAPTSLIPAGTNSESRKCWSPYSQYVIIDLSGITSFSAIRYFSKHFAMRKCV